MNIVIPLLVVITTAFMGFLTYNAYADCINPHCYAVVVNNPLSSNIQGLHYKIHVPDLHIDPTDCTNKAAIATGWVQIESKLNFQQWIESGITVGWIDDDALVDKCVQTESAYYAYSVVDGPVRVYEEINADPHGDAIGIQKRFQISKNSQNTWDVFYGDITNNVSDPGRKLVTLDYRDARTLSADFGAEGLISSDYTKPAPITEKDHYSSIPSTRFKEMHYKNNNNWIAVPDTLQFRLNQDDGYIGKFCGPGHMAVGAVTNVDCDFLGQVNQKPIPTSISNHVANGAALLIDLTATDPDSDYVKFRLMNRPTNGTLSHVNLAQYIQRNSPTSADLVYKPTRIGLDSFTYNITDGRPGNWALHTININVIKAFDTAFGLFDTFDGGMGNWIVVGDTNEDNDNDMWVSGDNPSTISGRTSKIAYASDCDTECSLTLRTKIDISEYDTPKLKFWRWVDGSFDNAGGQQGSIPDYLAVQVSTDNGATWAELDRWEGRGTFPGSVWEERSYDLTNYKSANFKVRFVTFENSNEEEVALDDIRILSTSKPSQIMDLTANGSPTQVALSWTKPNDGGEPITSYKIERKLSNGISWTTLTSNHSGESETYLDTTVSDDVSYQYRISAKNLIGTSDPSNIAEITTPMGDRPPLLDEITDQSMLSSDILVLDVYAHDDNDDSKQYSISGPSFTTISKINEDHAQLFLLPQASDAGIHTITVTVTESTSNHYSDIEQFQVEVIRVNNLPNSNNLSVTILEDLPTSVVLPAVDPDGDPLTFIVVTPPQHGAISGTSSNLIYTSNQNYNGLDSFTYKANDGFGDSNIATISITITPVNDSPSAQDDTATTQEETPIVISVLSNDSDIDLSSLVDQALSLGNYTEAPPQNLDIISPDILQNATQTTPSAILLDAIRNDQVQLEQTIETVQEAQTTVQQATIQLEDAQENLESALQINNQSMISQETQDLILANNTLNSAQDTLEQSQQTLEQKLDDLKIENQVESLLDQAQDLKETPWQELHIPVFVHLNTTQTKPVLDQINQIADMTSNYTNTSVVLVSSQDELNQIASLDSVQSITLPDLPVPVDIQSQTIPKTFANMMHQKGITGNNVTIAIIDDSFFLNDPAISGKVTYSALFDSIGSCANSITCGKPQGSSHGTAVAQIASAMAPSSNLELYAITTSVDFDFNPITSPSGSFHNYILALTAGTSTPAKYYAQSSVNQDGIFVGYEPLSSGVFIVAKDDSGAPTNSSVISHSLGAGTKYYRLSWMTTGVAKLEQFSDAQRSTLVSSTTLSIPSTITGLNTIQHSNYDGGVLGAAGTSGYTINYEIDNLRILKN